MVDSKELLQKLQTHTYAALPFPLSHQDFENAAATYFDFLTLPQEVKDKLYFFWNPEDPEGSEIGYKRTEGDKDMEVGQKDFKEYFHYHPDADEHYKDAILDPKVSAFFQAARTVFENAETTMQEVLKTLDEEFPGIYKSFCPDDKRHRRVVRFLKYDATGMGKFLARAHYDRGGCTLALAESAPGLRIGRDDASLTPVIHTDRTALLMPGFHFPELTGGKVSAAWHDVVQSSEDTFSDDAARWAIVFFANADGVSIPTSKDVHLPKSSTI